MLKRDNKIISQTIKWRFNFGGKPSKQIPGTTGC